MKLLKPSWVSHNGKLVQESGGPTWAFVCEGVELMRCDDHVDSGGGGSSGGGGDTFVACDFLNFASSREQAPLSKQI